MFFFNVCKTYKIFFEKLLEKIILQFFIDKYEFYSLRFFEIL